MALELAGDVADVYETGNEQTKRSYNLAFFKKILVLPELDQYGLCAGALIENTELTEPYAVLLAGGLAADVLAEAEQITAGATGPGAVSFGSTNGEDAPEGPSSSSPALFRTP